MRYRTRPLTSDDRGRLADFFNGLSFESRRQRFLAAKPALSPRELAYLTEIDHVGHEAIAAIDQRDDSIIGVARYARVPGRSEVADVAAAVAHEFQGMGIGSDLSRLLVRRALANGFTTLTATTLSENKPARALLSRLRFVVRATSGSEIDLELELESAG
jgi:RimJ/RimL family protein N-acetyltransferase